MAEGGALDVEDLAHLAHLHEGILLHRKRVAIPQRCAAQTRRGTRDKDKQREGEGSVAHRTARDNEAEAPANVALACARRAQGVRSGSAGRAQGVRKACGRRAQGVHKAWAGSQRFVSYSEHIVRMKEAAGGSGKVGRA